MCKRIREDIAAVRQRDPAARSGFEILLVYAGVHALFWHRPAHWLYRHHCFFLARLVSQLTRFFTGIEIHPGAKIGRRFVIDHGMGIVIGETAEVGDDCLIYHGVTLGGSGIVIGETAEVGDGCTLYQGVTLGGTGKDTGKRHPTLGRNVMVGCGAKVLGPVRVGDNCKIAANAVLLHSIDADSTAVGVPARVVRVSNVRLENERLDHVHIPDPIQQELNRAHRQIAALEKRLTVLEAELEKEKEE